MANYYIQSCVFTAQFPKLSFQISDYVTRHYGLIPVRCCVPRYKIMEFEQRMPEGTLRSQWQSLPDSAAFSEGDTVYSLCHNCNNIIEEMHPSVQVHSIWERIDADPVFPLPSHSGEIITIQDCWRAKDRLAEQAAVRSLLKKMGYTVLELPEHGMETNFCGVSLYRPQPPRNPKLAPKHYIEQAAGKFLPHSVAEQTFYMREHAKQFQTKNVVCYCHYCLEGLKIGGLNAFHIAELLFS